MIAAEMDPGRLAHRTPEPRPYRDARDLEKMRALLVAGRRADNGSYYVHAGDLDWWLFYTLDGEDWRRGIYLWEERERLIAWSLFTARWGTFDVFVHPDERGSPRAAAIYAWAIGTAGERLSAQGGVELSTMWVREDDAALTGFLESQGFRRDEGYLGYRERSLEGSPLAEINLPPGFHLRPVAGEHEAELRAAASYAAFEASMPIERYVERYRRFMRSPVYDPARDLMILAPDGRCAAFCLFWLDPDNRTGLFEPVGVHPRFRRMGLGKAVVAAGLKRMQAAGMARATVCAEHENRAARRLYQSLGFDLAARLRTYRKPVPALCPDRPPPAAIWAEVT